MSVELLDRTRKINKLLQKNATTVFVFNDVCDVLGDTLYSDILVFSRKGKILGRGQYFIPQDGDEDWAKATVGTFIDKALNDRLIAILSTKENVNLDTLGFDSNTQVRYYAMVVPIDIAGERLGTIFTFRTGKEYEIDDIILAEYGAAVVGLEMLRSLNEESAEELRKIQVIKSALSTLSTSEIEAVSQILKEMDGMEGILVASKLADSAGITRSVIVNALRKLESAGVIESRSSGMKGTYIRIQNDLILSEIQNLKKE